MTARNTEVLQDDVPAPARPRWGRILAWLGLATLLIILFLGLLRTQEGPIGVGKQAPEFTLITFDGSQFPLSELKGKVVLVNFWASWCKPCEQEAADLEAAWRFYQIPRRCDLFGGCLDRYRAQILGVFAKI